MFVRNNILIILAVTLITACNTEETPLHKKVDPFIGTGGHGHTYPGATAPFGMVQLSPDTRLTGWDGCGGYHYTDSVIYGFSHTHLQGTGVSDYGDLLLMPCTQFNDGEVWRDRYKSAFDKDSEVAHAGYYSVNLTDQNLQAELTTTDRVGIHKYTLNERDSVTLIIDLAHRDKIINYSIYPLNDSVIVGHRLSDNWATEQHFYFAMKFDKNFKWNDQLTEFEGNTIAQVPVFSMDFGSIDDLVVKVGVSFCSIEGALNNLDTEAPHYDFEAYRTANEAKWDDQLSRIEIEGASDNEETIFYTSLYHSCTVPNIASDVDGKYRGTDLKVHQLPEGETHYTVFSLWDTFRSLHPLLSWIEPDRTVDFVKTMLRMYEDGGQLPVWELASNYTGCMIGYHSVPVISDAEDWGLSGWDRELALEAMLQAADSAHLGLDAYALKGYIPSEHESESVSKTLEYCFDDACIAKYAAELGNDSIAERFTDRALFWRNLLHPESGFIQPKRDGAWVAEFDPTEVNFNYTEANGWQYTFFAPHDIAGQIKLAGSPEEYCEIVNNQFTTKLGTSGRNQADITGLIGQYAHGNEPSHHVAYLPTYGGQQWRTTELIDEIVSTLYTSQPDGLCGNEDCGQMSAWYVLSSIGLYPVAPGAGSKQLVVGSPQFKKVTVSPKGGNKLVLSKRGYGKYVNELNGSYKSWVSYDEIVNGGEITFKMGTKGSFGKEENDRPKTHVNDLKNIVVPSFTAPQSFQGDVEAVTIRSVENDAQILYRVNDGLWEEYSQPLEIHETCTLFAKCTRGEYESREVRHKIIKIDHDWDVKYTYPYSHQYQAAGENTLVDGLTGGTEFRTGDWQGFNDTPFEAKIDLGEELIVESMSLGCIQDIRPWIWLPENVQYFTSTDGINYELLETVTHDTPEDQYEKSVHRFTTNTEAKARYLMVRANPRGKIPDWHLGAGNNRWTFVDEWEINLAE